MGKLYPICPHHPCSLLVFRCLWGQCHLIPILAMPLCHPGLGHAPLGPPRAAPCPDPHPASSRQHTAGPTCRALPAPLRHTLPHLQSSPFSALPSYLAHFPASLLSSCLIHVLKSKDHPPLSNRTNSEKNYHSSELQQLAAHVIQLALTQKMLSGISVFNYEIVLACIQKAWCQVL